MQGNTELSQGNADPYTLTDVDIMNEPEAPAPDISEPEPVPAVDVKEEVITQTEEETVAVPKKEPKKETKKETPKKETPKKEVPKKDTVKPKEKTEAEKRAEAEKAAAEKIRNGRHSTDFRRMNTTSAKSGLNVQWFSSFSYPEYQVFITVMKRGFRATMIRSTAVVIRGGTKMQSLSNSLRLSQI